MNLNPDIPNKMHSPAKDSEDYSHYYSDNDLDLLLLLDVIREEENMWIHAVFP